MKLTVMERLEIISVLPPKGTRLEQMLVQDIIKKISPTQEELKKIDYNEEPVPNNPSRVKRTWNVKKDKEKVIELDEAYIMLIKKQFQNLDEKGEITQANLDLCNKILG